MLESDIVPFLSLSLLFLFLSLSLYLSPSLCLFLSSYIFFSNYYLNKFRLIFTLRQGSKLYFSSLVNPRKAQFINLKPPFVEITFLVIKISQRPEVFAQIWPFFVCKYHQIYILLRGLFFCNAKMKTKYFDYLLTVWTYDGLCGQGIFIQKPFENYSLFMVFHLKMIFTLLNIARWTFFELCIWGLFLKTYIFLKCNIFKEPFDQKRLQFELSVFFLLIAVLQTYTYK